MASTLPVPVADTAVTLWIVDWDIPERPPGRRISFYRRLRKLREQHEFHGKMSTQSVFIVQDRELAIQVYLLAQQYGRANLYIAYPTKVEW